MPKTYEAYKLTPAAKDDLAGIWLYGLEQWSRETADKYYRNIISGLRG